MKRVIYLRVSKKDLNENTQLPVITKTFNLKVKDCILLQERKSGYKAETQQHRHAMNKLIELVESDEIEEIYVYSLERLYRNIDWF